VEDPLCVVAREGMVIRNQLDGATDPERIAMLQARLAENHARSCELARLQDATRSPCADACDPPSPRVSPCTCDAGDPLCSCL